MNDDDEEKEKKIYYGVLHAPYVKGFSERIQRELRKHNVGWVMKRGQSISSKVQELKTPSKIFEQKGVIYKIGCQNCEAIYIGETGQTLSKRIMQHKADVRQRKKTNAMFMHLKLNRRHKIDWEGTRIIDRERRWDNRKILESLFINAVDQSGSTRNK